MLLILAALARSVKWNLLAEKRELVCNLLLDEVADLFKDMVCMTQLTKIIDGLKSQLLMSLPSK